jgi:hypothetical protein
VNDLRLIYYLLVAKRQFGSTHGYPNAGTHVVWRHFQQHKVCDLRLMLSELGINECFRFESEAQKEGDGGEELSGGARWPSERCDTVAGASSRRRSMVVRAVVTGP